MQDAEQLAGIRQELLWGMVRISRELRIFGCWSNFISQEAYNEHQRNHCICRS